MSNILSEIGSDLKDTFLALLKMAGEKCAEVWEKLPELWHRFKSGSTKAWNWLKSKRTAHAQSGANTQQAAPSRRTGTLWKRSKQKIMFGILLAALAFVIFFRPESAPEVVQKTTEGASQAEEVFSWLTVFWASLSLVLVYVVYRFTNQHLTYRNSRTMFWLLAVWGIVRLLIPNTIHIPLWVTVTLVGSVLLIMFKVDGHHRAAKWDLGFIALVLCIALIATHIGKEDIPNVSGAVVSQTQSEITDAAGVLKEKVLEYSGSISSKKAGDVEKALRDFSLVPVFSTAEIYLACVWLLGAIIFALMEWKGCNWKFYRTVSITFILVLLGGYVFFHPLEVLELEALVFPFDTDVRKFRVLAEMFAWWTALVIFWKTRAFTALRPLTWAVLIFAGSLLKACVM